MEHPLQQLDPSRYPALLTEINDPPKQLYLRGSLPDDEKKFLCVVGSRSYSPYGKQVTETLISGLSGYPVVIVSGLALGIDSISHSAALGAGLQTVAIPGSGLGWGVLHPRSHVNLAHRILSQDGALLSEFEENFRATPYSFPQRNRLMAGISKAVLVIEATTKSGTLITARLASDYNRDVLAVPGSVMSSNSFGPHMLIRLGATAVTCSNDILEALNIPVRAPGVERISRTANTSDEEKFVLGLLEKSPRPRDNLITELHLPTTKANILISAMELKGLIEEKYGEVRAL
jgi:DNA processing protein